MLQGQGGACSFLENHYCSQELISGLLWSLAKGREPWWDCKIVRRVLIKALSFRFQRGHQVDLKTTLQPLFLKKTSVLAQQWEYN